MAKRVKTDYSHPFVVVYEGNLPPHPRYAKLSEAIGNVDKKLEGNREWATKFSSASVPSILEGKDRLSKLKVLDPGGTHHDSVVVDLHTSTSLTYTIINNQAA